MRSRATLEARALVLRVEILLRGLEPVALSVAAQRKSRSAGMGTRLLSLVAALIGEVDAAEDASRSEESVNANANASTTEAAEKRERASAERAGALDEIVRSEEVYRDAMVSMEDEVAIPLREAGVVSEAEWRVLFSHLGPVRRVACEFMSRLTEAMSSEGDAGAAVAQVFLDMIGYLSVFSPYVNALGEAQAMLAQLSSREAFVAWRQSVGASMPRGQGPFSGLEKPFQRMLKYPLLLARVQKNTDEEHESYAVIAEAASAVQAKANDINEKKRQAEQRARLLEISQQTWINDKRAVELVVPSRRVVEEGKGVLVWGGVEEAVEWVACNDVVFFVRGGGGAVKQRRRVLAVLEWKDVRVEEVYGWPEVELEDVVRDVVYAIGFDGEEECERFVASASASERA